jgi:hypothetical protein
MKRTTKKARGVTTRAESKAQTKSRLTVIKGEKESTPVSRASKDGNFMLYVRRISQAVEKAKGHSLSMEQAASATGLKRPGLGLVTVMTLIQFGWLHQSSDRRISLPKVRTAKAA